MPMTPCGTFTGLPASGSPSPHDTTESQNGHRVTEAEDESHSCSVFLWNFPPPCLADPPISVADCVICGVIPSERSMRDPSRLTRSDQLAGPQHALGDGQVDENREDQERPPEQVPAERTP